MVNARSPAVRPDGSVLPPPDQVAVMGGAAIAAPIMPGPARCAVQLCDRTAPCERAAFVPRTVIWQPQAAWLGRGRSISNFYTC